MNAYLKILISHLKSRWLMKTELITWNKNMHELKWKLTGNRGRGREKGREKVEEKIARIVERI